MSTMVGGISNELKAADETVADICEKIREELESKIGKKFNEFNAVNYKTQLVNGVNYFIKVKVSNSEHYHVRAHKAFNGTITFVAHQDGKSHDDDITYF